MQHNEKQNGAEHPQEPELNVSEQQMLQKHLDLERLQRWEKVIEQTVKKEALKRRAMQWLKWAAVVGAALLFIALLWQRFYPVEKPKQPAAFAALVDYPFMDQQVRGAGTAADETWKQCVAQYQKGAYAEALEGSKTLDNPFFKGMCLLQLKQFEAAEKQFIVAPNDPDFQPEILYYKAYALLQFGKKEEAKVLLNQALARSDLRERWKKAAEALLHDL
jgi:tetratricopeptide (TPR) repeat protein